MEHLLLFSYLGHVSYKLSLLTQDLVTLFLQINMTFSCLLNSYKTAGNWINQRFPDEKTSIEGTPSLCLTVNVLWTTCKGTCSFIVGPFKSFNLIFHLPFIPTFYYLAPLCFKIFISVCFMRRSEVVSKLEQFQGTEILRIWSTPHTLSRSFQEGKIRGIMTMTTASDSKITSPHAHTCTPKGRHKKKIEFL